MCTYTIETQDNCSRESHIGDYAVINCNYYGNYDLLENLSFEAELRIDYNRDSKVILVGQTQGENFKPIGELQVPDSDLKVLKNCLNMGWEEVLFTCKISQNDEKAKINDRLRVTIWVKELL